MLPFLTRADATRRPGSFARPEGRPYTTLTSSARALARADSKPWPRDGPGASQECELFSGIFQDRRRVPDTMDDTLPAADRRPARHRVARARATGRRRRAAVQATRPTAERARPHREPRSRIPPLAARPCGTAVPRQRSALKTGTSRTRHGKQDLHSIPGYIELGVFYLVKIGPPGC